jgi:hypothetical protein
MYNHNELRKHIINIKKMVKPEFDHSLIEEEDILDLFNQSQTYNLTAPKHKYIQNLLLLIKKNFPHILTSKHLKEQQELLERESTPLHSIAEYEPKEIPSEIISDEIKLIQNLNGDTLSHIIEPRPSLGFEHTWKCCSPESMKIKNTDGKTPIQNWGMYIGLKETLQNIPVELLDLESLIEGDKLQKNSVIINNLHEAWHIKPEIWFKFSKSDTDLQKVIDHVTKETNNQQELISNLSKALRIQKQFNIHSANIKQAISTLPKKPANSKS